MPTSSEFQVVSAPWGARIHDLQAVRRTVFVLEQRVPEDEEWDAQDAESRHVLAIAEGEAIGTGRLLPDGHIGRMAVLKPWRQRGVGRAMLAALIDMARAAGFVEVVLHAQTHAMPFYEKQGFTAEAPEFMEAGIPHRVMRLSLRE